MSLTIFTGCKIKNEKTNIEVKGLTLKISLISVAEDIYKANFKNMDLFNEDIYKNAGEYGMYYYGWLKDTYSTMDSKMKGRLINIFNNYGSSQYIIETINLDDNTSVDEIINYINTKSNLDLNNSLKEDIQVFFSYFYKEYLDDFIKDNSSKIEMKSRKMNRFLGKKDTDIFEFMEVNSGLKFDREYKAILYYDLVPIGAYGFNSGNYKISTIQPNVTADNLLSTPFHEYTHDLLRNFTRDIEFIKVAEKLVDDKSLSEMYEYGSKDAYDWIGWCEENLTEGFAKYLDYKYYGKKPDSELYVYDLEFYQYLVDTNFNPKDTNLKAASISFYKSIIGKKL